jgi:hypothetical protein
MFHPMMPWALGDRLQRRTILACSILLAMLACAALPGVSDASRKFRGKGFTTIVPTDWKTGKGKQGGARVYGAASRSTRPNVPANTMQLGVSVVPVADMERRLGRKLPSSLEQLLGLVMQATQQSSNARVTAPFRASTLGGRSAASGALQFNASGTTMLVSQTVSVYRGRVYVLAFNLDTALEFQGLPILGRAHRHWRWR